MIIPLFYSSKPKQTQVKCNIHKLTNPDTSELVALETQVDEYLEEDDIERFNNCISKPENKVK